MFSVSACNTLVTPVTLRRLKGQTGVSGKTVIKIKNFIIKPLIWLQGCQNEVENTARQSAQESTHRIYVEHRNEQLTGTHRDAQHVSINSKQGYTKRVEKVDA